MKTNTFTVNELFECLQTVRNSPFISGEITNSVSADHAILSAAKNRLKGGEIQVAPIDSKNQFVMLRLESLKIGAVGADQYFRGRSASYDPDKLSHSMLDSISGSLTKILNTQPTTNNSDYFKGVRDRIDDLRGSEVDFMNDFIDTIHEEEINAEPQICPPSKGGQIQAVYVNALNKGLFMPDAMGFDRQFWNSLKNDKDNEMSLG